MEVNPKNFIGLFIFRKVLIALHDQESNHDYYDSNNPTECHFFGMWLV